MPSRAASIAPSTTTPGASHPLLAGIANDPERLKKALRLLVEGGLMAKSEAKRIWEKAKNGVQ